MILRRFGVLLLAIGVFALMPPSAEAVNYTFVNIADTFADFCGHNFSNVHYLTRPAINNHGEVAFHGERDDTDSDSNSLLSTTVVPDDNHHVSGGDGPPGVCCLGSLGGNDIKVGAAV